MFAKSSEGFLVDFLLLPVEAEHARGSQSEPERQVPLLLGQQLPGSPPLRLEAADVLWMWRHLLVGKAKIHRQASESGILLGGGACGGRLYMPRNNKRARTPG